MSNQDDKIRSALEIALEKAQRLGPLSDEEKKRLRAEELASAGEALAQRYLNGVPLNDIEMELATRVEDERPVVRGRLLSHLLDTIDLSRGSGNDRTLAAIERLSGNAELARALNDLLQEHQRALEQTRQENAGTLEAAKRKELEQKGISGSAVEPAIESSADWVRAQQDLDSHYRQRLDEIRRRYGSPSEPSQDP